MSSLSSGAHPHNASIASCIALRSTETALQVGPVISGTDRWAVMLGFNKRMPSGLRWKCGLHCMMSECADLLEIRKKYFAEKSLYSLFRNVIPEVIFDFLREIGVFYKV